MTSLRQNFRRWWQIPRRAGDRLEHRQVSFLELFYDLVYVVIIAELSHTLSSHVGWSGLGGFAFLFVIVWWAWLNGATYHDLHGNNDIRTRAFTFLQMFSVVAMAVFAEDALGESSAGFALSYASFQLILTYMWWRTGVHDPDHRPLSNPYSLGFLVNTVLFGLSAFMPAPVRFYLWGAALLLSLALPVYMFSLGSRSPQVRAQVEIAISLSSSLVERFGLFTIIVLGEVIVGVVGGVTAHHDLTWRIGGVAGLGAVIAIGLWWVYFDFVSHRIPLVGVRTVTTWYYLHLPLTMGIAAVGAAVLNIVEHGSEPLTSEVRWLLVGTVAVVLVCTALLTRTVQVSEQDRPPMRVGRRVMLIAAVLIAVLGLTIIKTIPLLVGVTLLLLAPIYFALRVWLARQVQTAA